MNVGWPAIVLLLALMSNGRVAAQAKLTSSSLQTQFSAEDTGVEKPVVIPEEVMVILRQDEGVRNALKYENVPADKPPASWFSASEVHLRGSAQDDLVVLGEGDLRGANVITFWIFRDTDHGHELVLTQLPQFEREVLFFQRQWGEVSTTSVRIPVPPGASVRAFATAQADAGWAGRCSACAG